MNIRIAWSRRSKLPLGETTDINGYSPWEFSFTDGKRIIEDCINISQGDASCWQKVLFETPAYLTRIEIWQTKDEQRFYIYAYPDREIQEQLK